MTPLNDRQKAALKMVGHQYVTRYVQGSIPSLVRRGLVTVEKQGGRLTGRYYLTEAGADALLALRAESERPARPPVLPPDLSIFDGS